METPIKIIVRIKDLRTKEDHAQWFNFSDFKTIEQVKRYGLMHLAPNLLQINIDGLYENGDIERIFCGDFEQNLRCL